MQCNNNYNNTGITSFSNATQHLLKQKCHHCYVHGAYRSLTVTGPLKYKIYATHMLGEVKTPCKKIKRRWT